MASPLFYYCSRSLFVNSCSCFLTQVWAASRILDICAEEDDHRAISSLRCLR